MKFPLPAVTNPTGFKCFQVKVPNDPDWIAMFWGVLYELTYWNKYDRDAAHTAKDIARRWYDVFLDARDSECPVQIMFRQPVDCSLEVSFDGGLTYTEIYNGYECAIDAINNKIADGTLVNPTQHAPDGVASVNQCFNYHVVLQGNNRWHCPIPVGDGYTITVSNVKGGWSDGYALGSYWQCPDGQYYSLGYCTGSYISGYPSDPIPSLYHMRLIGYAGSYFDLYDVSHTIPTGTGDTALLIQANDSDLSDNLGSIEFDVEVCNYSVWCKQFLNGAALGTTPLNIYTVSNFGTIGVYDSGNDLYYCPDASIDRAYRTIEAHVDLSSVSGFTVTEIAVHVESVASGGVPSDLRSQIIVDGTERGYRTQSKNFSGTDNYVIHPTGLSLTDCDDIKIYLESAKYPESNHSVGSLKLTKVVIKGTGTNPFGSSDC